MKKLTISLISILLFAITLCGCSKGAIQESEVVTIKVGTWKTAQTIQPYFYQDHVKDSYEVKVFPFTNPGDQKAALLSGSLDLCGTTLVTAIIAASNNEPVKIVCSLCNKCSALVVGKNLNINSEKDLKGKSIAYVPGTMHHILLLEILKRNGLDPNEDVTLKRIDFFDMGQALQDGTIDAFCSGEPYPSQAVLNGYGEILNYPYFDDSISTINAAMITTEDMIKNNPNIVQAAVEAHVKATNELNNDQEKWMKKSIEFGTDKDILKFSTDNIELCAEIDDEYIKHTKKLAEKMLELGIITKMPDIDAMFDTSFLNNIEKE